MFHSIYSDYGSVEFIYGFSSGAPESIRYSYKSQRQKDIGSIYVLPIRYGYKSDTVF